MMETEKKEYKTIDEEIKYLIESKNIDPSTIDRDAFNEKTYLSLITPYTDLVAIGRNNDGEHIYKENTNFNEFIEWGKIDKYMSIILHNIIGAFEKKLKLFLERTICSWMYSTGDKSCCDYNGWNNYISNMSYLNFMNIYEVETNPNTFAFADSSVKNSRISAIKNILDINAGASRQTEIVKHYRNKNYLPFWVTVHELTINELIQLFSIMKYNDKKPFIAEILGCEIKKLSFVDVRKFESKLSYLTILRNKINHYEPIIPLIIKIKNNLYNILYSSINVACTYFKRLENIGLVMNKPSISTLKNKFNETGYNRVLSIVDLLEKML